MQDTASSSIYSKHPNYRTAKSNFVSRNQTVTYNLFLLHLRLKRKNLQNHKLSDFYPILFQLFIASIMGARNGTVNVMFEFFLILRLFKAVIKNVVSLDLNRLYLNLLFNKFMLKIQIEN